MSKKYNLTDQQIRELANVFYMEQGNVAGVKACASHACNYLEKWVSAKYKDPYEAVIHSGWWGKSESVKQRMSQNTAPTSCIEGTGEVIRDGKRTLPEYIDEYDWLYDITSATNNGTPINHLDRSKYVKDVTVVKNRFGSTWTFYCFPDGVNGYCDPFGYISKPAEIQNEDNSDTVPETPEAPKPVYKTEYDLEEVELYSGSPSVIILQSILFTMGYTGVDGKPIAIDGSAGANTIYALCHFQDAAGLTPDGVCGKKTWTKLINGLHI